MGCWGLSRRVCGGGRQLRSRLLRLLGLLVIDLSGGVREVPIMATRFGTGSVWRGCWSIAMVRETSRVKA